MALTLSLLLTLNSTLISGPITAGKDVTYKIDGAEFEGYSATPYSSKGITVYVIQDWNGIDKHEKGVCDKLASAGYDAFAIDVYGKGIRPQSPTDCSAEAGKYYGNPTLYMSRLTEGMKYAKKNRKSVAIGYCFGGTGVLEMARRNLNVQGVVSFHGGLKPLPGDTASKINSKVMILHGEADTAVPMSDLETAKTEFKKAAAFQYHTYPNAVHGFTVVGPRYNEAAEQASWKELMKFLSEMN
jgi:dienelactone hydrolase